VSAGARRARARKLRCAPLLSPQQPAAGADALARTAAPRAPLATPPPAAGRAGGAPWAPAGAPKTRAARAARAGVR
jgi:hypothetical protein